MNRLEHSSGVLEVGHAADLAAVDADVLAVDAGEIGDVRVTDTFVDGRHVHGG